MNEGTALAVKALDSAGEIVGALGRVAIDMAIKTTDEKRALLEQNQTLKNRSETLGRQLASDRKNNAIEKSKLAVALRKLANIKVLVDEISPNDLVFDATGVLAEIKEDLDRFCSDDFQRYVAECIADRARIKAAIAARTNTANPQ